MPIDSIRTPLAILSSNEFCWDKLGMTVSLANNILYQLLTIWRGKGTMGIWLATMHVEPLARPAVQQYCLCTKYERGLWIITRVLSFCFTDRENCESTYWDSDIYSYYSSSIEWRSRTEWIQASFSIFPLMSLCWITMCSLCTTERSDLSGLLVCIIGGCQSDAVICGIVCAIDCCNGKSHVSHGRNVCKNDWTCIGRASTCLM